MSEERLERIEEKVDILVSGQIDLGARVSKLEEGQTELRAAVMQIAEGHAAHTRQIDRGFQQLHAVLEQRLQPLEASVRDHSAVLKKHG